MGVCVHPHHLRMSELNSTHSWIPDIISHASRWLRSASGKLYYNLSARILSPVQVKRIEKAYSILLAKANKSHMQKQMQTSISLHRRGCYGGGKLAAKSSSDDKLVLTKKGQSLGHLQTLHITASRSSQEETERRRRGL